jgi:hypothetical protein
VVAAHDIHSDSHKWGNSNIQHPTPNIQHPVATGADAGSVLDVGCWMLDVHQSSRNATAGGKKPLKITRPP